MRTQNTADRLDEIMILADTHAYARVKDGTPRAQLPYTHLKNAVQAVLAENETLRTGYDAAQLEITSLRERVQMLGQLARDVNSRRVLELEAQLEAVQEGRDIQGDIDRYNENTMTDTKQPEALRLADAMERFTKSSHWWTDGEPIHIAVAAELRSLHTENDTLRAGYDAARLEIESLQAQAQQCGAGAGCCAQAARIEALQAQLEAVGAVGPLVGALEIAEAALADIGDADREPGDDVAWCEARAAQALPEVRAALITAAPQQAAQDALAYQAACSLATRLFKKHFSKNVEYASGKVTWGLCDTTAGVISQIVNMVFWLVEPAAQAQPDDQQARGTDAS